uniref:Uncharacterized protein n=1 Tax=Sinocyclocheilus anshuiensis TaxID=1608454 RepID=A0A671RGU6_9TELE
MDHPSPPHPYTMNMWWRLTNHTVKKNGLENCYVCAQFPHSTTGVDWWPHQDHNTSTIMAVVAVAAAPFNDSSTLLQDEEWRKIKVTKRLFGQVATVRGIPTNLTCYSRVTGTNPLGKIPKSKCNVIYEENETNLATRQRCLRCLNNAISVPGDLRQSTIAEQYLFHNHCTRATCEAACAVVHVPDEEGTGVVENTYWQCGYAIYVSLARNWTGTCALIQLHGGTIVLRHQPREIMRRKETGLLNIKLLAVFAPGIGVASLMQEVQVTRYELISFINTTKMMEGIEELRGLRLAALQNLLVLDQLTAAQGRVCVIVGETCCTYIPENDADGHVIDEGIVNLTYRAKTLTGWETNSGSFGWGWFKGIFTDVTNLMMMVICIVCSILLFNKLLLFYHHFVSCIYTHTYINMHF